MQSREKTLLIVKNLRSIIYMTLCLKPVHIYFASWKSVTYFDGYVYVCQSVSLLAFPPK